METETLDRTPTRPVTAIAVVLIAMVVRGGVCYWNFDQFAADPDAYTRIAETLATERVYGLRLAVGEATPTAFRPPLYPLILSALTRGGQLSRFGVACFHTALGVITVLCTYFACQRLLGGSATTKASLAAAALVAIDPILLQQSTLVMTETLATTLASMVVLFWATTTPKSSGTQATFLSAVLIGLLLALAYLCRPTFLVWAGLLVWAELIRLGVRLTRKHDGLLTFLRTILILVPAVVCMGLWAGRNWRVMGHPIWATTHGGYTLLLANNPLFYDYLRNGRFGVAWDAEFFLAAYVHRYQGDPNSDAFWRADWSQTETKSADPAGRRVSEFDDDRVCYEAALATIRREPAMFAWSCLVRSARLWSPLPHRTTTRSWLQVGAIGCYYTCFYLAVLYGMLRLRITMLSRSWWPVWTLAIALSLVHAVYWSNLRMRAPIIPAMAVIACAGLLPREAPATPNVE